MTLVSVVIACHNGERFICHAIDSVLDQRLPDIEVVVADDASSDRSCEIIAGYGPPVHLVRVANGNTQATRNAAIAASRGALIGILDQDDAWRPGKLRRQIACLEANRGLGLCYTDTRVVDPNGRELADKHNPLFHPSDQRDALTRLLGVNIMTASTVLVRRSVLDQVGLFDPAFHLAGDWELWLRVVESFPIAGIPEPLVDYCWHGENLSRGRSGMLRESIAVQEAALERIARHPHWGADPELAPHLESARQRLASRWSELGMVLSRAGERGGALHALRRATAIDPGTSRHWSRLLRASISPAHRPSPITGECNMSTDGSRGIDRAGRILALILAFSAWSLTGPASIALGLLLLLFLADIPRHWDRLRHEPALWLLAGAVVLTSLLAARAALLFPQIAGDQWQAVSAWCAPLCFIALAWWIRDSPQLVWRLMAAAFLSLMVGVLRKTDWSLVPQVLGGMRYEFGYATTGLAFIASVCLVGLMVFRHRITRLVIGGTPRPVLGSMVWGLALAFVLIILVVTQSRGAALLLAATGLGYLALEWLPATRAGNADDDRPRWTPVLYAVGLILLAGAFLWATKLRQEADLDAIAAARTTGHLSYQSSLGARVNLHRVGLAVIAARPLLGWGPGTSSTEFVVPEGLVTLDRFDRVGAPTLSHLHSVALEILARFGLVGALLSGLAAVVLLRALRSAWSNPRVPPDLRTFLALTGIMTLFFCTYEFRLVHTEFRFFAILYLGILYGLHLNHLETRQSPRGSAE